MASDRTSKSNIDLVLVQFLINTVSSSGETVPESRVSRIIHICSDQNNWLYLQDKLPVQIYLHPSTKR